MDIRCERCQTEYEFDEARLPEAGLPVKCTTCGHVFKVRRGMGAPAAGPVQLRRGGQVIAVAPDAATVAQWIAERRLLADDEFSSGNAPFRRLADAPEFARAFAPAVSAPPPVVDAPAAVTQQMVAPVFAPKAQQPPFAAPQQTAQFHVGPSIPTAAAATADTAATMQFRVPADMQGTPAYGSAPVAAQPPASTMQFRVPAASMPADPGPAAPQQTAQFHVGSIPTAQPVAQAPVPAATAQFNVGSIPTAQPAASAPVPAQTAQFNVGAAAMPPAGSFGAPPAKTAQMHVGAIPAPAAEPAGFGPAKTAQMHVGAIHAPAPEAQFRVPADPPTRPEGFRVPAEPPKPEALQFRVPVSSAMKPADQITNVMPIPGNQADPDAQATAQFKLPTASRLSEALAAAEDDTAPTLHGAPMLKLPTPVAPAAPTPAMAPAPSFEPAKTEAFKLPVPAEPPEAPTPPPTPASLPLNSLVGKTEPNYAPPPVTAEEEDASLARTEPAPPREEPRRAPVPKRQPIVNDSEPPDDEEDPEILAFQQAGKKNRMIAAVVAGVAVVGALAYFVVLPLVMGAGKPSEEALAALETGRKAYLEDSAAKFAEAEASFTKALSLAGKAKFPQAHAALAELRCAWAEQLIDDQARLAKLAQEHTAANLPDAAELAKKANAETEEVKTRLKAAFEEAKAAYDLDPQGLAGNRALVDYFRVSGDAKQLGQHLKAVEKAAATDAETKAHLAAAWALEAGKLPAAEATLAEIAKNSPEFVRAAYWLAEVREKKGDSAGAAEAMKAILAKVPGHEAAKGYLDAKKASEEAAKKASEEAAKAEAAKAEAPADAKPADAKPAEQKPEPVKAEAKPAEKPAEKPAPAIDTDKLIAQANKLLEKNKSDKALALCEQILAVKPNHLDALYDKGVALFNMERIDDAIATFKTALGVNPNFSDAMIVLAEAYKTKGQTKDALQWYRKYLEVMPNGDDAAAARANITKLSGK